MYSADPTIVRDLKLAVDDPDRELFKTPNRSQAMLNEYCLILFFLLRKSDIRGRLYQALPEYQSGFDYRKLCDGCECFAESSPFASFGRPTGHH